MPIRSRKNQYRGVNAHLHSHFQAHGGWSGFHNTFITFLTAAINANLPAGYIVDTDQSLQIKEFHPDTGERLRRPEPDLTVYNTSAAKPPFSAASAPAATFQMPVLATLESPDLYYSAAVIYELQADAVLGKPITQIKLLSPSNKPPGDGYLQYREKRIAALKSGLNLVEIDLLHETDSPIKGLPSYRLRQAAAYPYAIIISSPHPSLQTGQTWGYGFSVDDPIPEIDIPLAGSDTCRVDLQVPYDQAYENTLAYSQRVDYDRPPENFERYSPADQARIRAVMERIQTAAQQGFNVETQLVPYT